MRFRRKRLKKQTHIDNFFFLKKNPKRIYLAFFVVPFDVLVPLWSHLRKITGRSREK